MDYNVQQSKHLSSMVTTWLRTKNLLYVPNLQGKVTNLNSLK